ncbi:hypothetical protein LP414_14925 [Polaromonas sp. P1(28)-13]|nr:hypothetical protein LP414_14925 [Polaromonas sp. P1(28)-13]
MRCTLSDSALFVCVRAQLYVALPRCRGPASPAARTITVTAKGLVIGFVPKPPR